MYDTMLHDDKYDRRKHEKEKMMDSVYRESARCKTKDDFYKFKDEADNRDRLIAIQRNKRMIHQEYINDMIHADQRNRKIAECRAAADRNDKERKQRDLNRPPNQYGMTPSRKDNYDYEDNQDFEDRQDVGYRQDFGYRQDVEDYDQYLEDYRQYVENHRQSFGWNP